MVFSPAFRSDATVFISGFKLGVARSTDGGITFQTLWGSDPAAVALITVQQVFWCIDIL